MTKEHKYDIIVYRKVEKEMIKERGVERDLRVCVICGDSFSRLTNAITCSEECGSIRAKEMQEREYKNDTGTLRQCEICGEDFLSEHGRKICSQECKEERARNYYREKVQFQENIPCSRCGKIFKREHKAKFCSEECKKEHTREYNRIKKREQREREALEQGKEPTNYESSRATKTNHKTLDDYSVGNL